MSISLDGFVAGPDQSRENPLGVGGLEVHRWHMGEPTHDADVRARDALMRPRGAHHPHDPIAMEGGTTFHFITEGFDVAFERAEAAAGDLGVDIAGGASTVRQALAAGVIDELILDVAPVLLGAGERLFDGVQDPGLEPVEVLHSPLATHVRYRVGR